MCLAVCVCVCVRSCCSEKQLSFFSCLARLFSTITSHFSIPFWLKFCLLFILKLKTLQGVSVHHNAIFTSQTANSNKHAFFLYLYIFFVFVLFCSLLKHYSTRCAGMLSNTSVVGCPLASRTRLLI